MVTCSMKSLATVVDPGEEPWPFNAPSDLLVEKSHRGKKSQQGRQNKIAPSHPNSRSATATELGDYFLNFF